MGSPESTLFVFQDDIGRTDVPRAELISLLELQREDFTFNALDELLEPISWRDTGKILPLEAPENHATIFFCDMSYLDRHFTDYFRSDLSTSYGVLPLKAPCGRS